MKLSKTRLIKNRYKTIFISVFAFAAGMIMQRYFFSQFLDYELSIHQLESEPEKKETQWTCSMHPQIKLPKPGKCPICFMDLIPLGENESNESGEREISLSDYSKKLLEIETYEVIRKFVEAEIRMTGKVDYDETRVSYISAWIPGRLDRLYVNYTGIAVKKGDHLADIYSPDIITAQEELIQALKTAKDLKHSESEILRNTAHTTVIAAREKLRLLGLNSEQINKIEQHQETSDHITIFSPISGIVIHKNAKEGMYVQTGSKIYTIADLSVVWVKLDAYESDLRWVRYGAKVEFTTEAYPEKIFTGTISFIDPVINPDTRTTNVRVIVSNESLDLKPGMFVRAVVRSKVASEGQVTNKQLAGKWISPMHPEIIKDEPGTCDVCGMPLVSAESLGYVDSTEKNAPIVIPVSAAMKTGKRAVVYIEVPDKQKPTYEGREIILGSRLGDYYIVEDGLSEGERVVIRGSFKLDAELQIQAKHSMMSHTEKNNDTHHLKTNELSSEKNSHEKIFKVPLSFRSQFNDALNIYFELQKALADDDPQQAKSYAANLKDYLNKIDMNLLKDNTHTAWMNHVKKLRSAIDNLFSVKSLEEQRKYFAVLSNHLTITVKLFPPSNEKIYKVSCPMAFDNQGASWLQDTNEIKNPYFGAVMLRCGEIDEEIYFPDLLKDNDNE